MNRHDVASLLEVQVKTLYSLEATDQEAKFAPWHVRRLIKPHQKLIYILFLMIIQKCLHRTTCTTWNGLIVIKFILKSFQGSEVGTHWLILLWKRRNSLMEFKNARTILLGKSILEIEPHIPSNINIDDTSSNFFWNRVQKPRNYHVITSRPSMHCWIWIIRFDQITIDKLDLILSRQSYSHWPTPCREVITNKYLRHKHWPRTVSIMQKKKNGFAYEDDPKGIDESIGIEDAIEGKRRISKWGNG